MPARHLKTAELAGFEPNLKKIHKVFHLLQGYLLAAGKLHRLSTGNFSPFSYLF